MPTVIFALPKSWHRHCRLFSDWSCR